MSADLSVSSAVSLIGRHRTVGGLLARPEYRVLGPSQMDPQAHPGLSDRALARHGGAAKASDSDSEVSLSRFQESLYRAARPMPS